MTSRPTATRSAATPRTTSTFPTPIRPRRPARSATTGSICSTAAIDVRTSPIRSGPSTPPRSRSCSNCGYNSARSTNQFVPPPSETMPPQDPFAIRVAGSAATSVTLATLKSYVTRVEQNGGGWAPLVFHQICNACDANSISPADFAAFLDWLQPRSRQRHRGQDRRRGHRRRRPARGRRAGRPRRAQRRQRACATPRSNRTPTATRRPTAGTSTTTATNTYTWTRTTDAHSGSARRAVDVSNYHDGDGKLVSHPATWASAPHGHTRPPLPDHRLVQVERARSPSSPPTATRVGAFAFWDTSPSFPASSTWTQASWVTPSGPQRHHRRELRARARRQRLRHRRRPRLRRRRRLRLSRHHTAHRRDHRAPPTAPASPAPPRSRPPPPTTSPSTTSTSWSTEPVVGTATSGPYNLNWNSTNVPNGTHTIRARAVDLAGNTTTSSASDASRSRTTSRTCSEPVARDGDREHAELLAARRLRDEHVRVDAHERRAQPAASPRSST